MLILRAKNCFKSCNLHDLYIYLDNGVMTTPKRRILSFVFTVLYIFTFLFSFFSQQDTANNSTVVLKGHPG